jgi:molybdate transport system substrate-binding protein
MTRLVSVLLPLALASSGPAAHAATISVFAASSLTDALSELARDYQTKTSNTIELQFGGAVLLARQIGEGARTDIFFSADESSMDALETNGLIEKQTRRSRLSNSLVIVVPADSTLSIRSPTDLTAAKVQRIALPDPQAVGAGIYAREYLNKIQLWDKIAPKVVSMASARATLAAVEFGDTDAGIVYRTDAAVTKRVRVACTVPREDGPKISYSMAVLKQARNQQAARAFLDYLDSDAAGRVFEKFGFILGPRAR